MKRIFAILIGIVLVCTFTIVAFAEGEDAVPTVESTAEEESTSEEKFTVPEPIAEKTPKDPNDLSVDDIVNYAKAHTEEISVIVSLIISAIYAVSRNKKVVGSIATVNNNAVVIAENSKNSMKEMSLVVTEYKESMASMLEEIRRNNDERAQLESSLSEVSSYLKATRLANVELANEVAELLVLANIPNSKKDELYARHLAAVNAISEAETAATTNAEVKENDSEDEA